MPVRSFAFVTLALAGAFLLQGLPAQEAPGALVLNPPEPKQAAPVRAAADEHVLEFTDGARIHGRLVKLGREEIEWRRGGIAQPLFFPLRDVRRLTFRAPARGAEFRSNATLQLTGGGWLAGDISSLAEGSFRMKLESSSELPVARDKVLWMFLSPTTSPDAYDGPGEVAGTAGWNAGGAWESTDAGLVARGTPSPITRKFECFPEKADIEVVAGDTNQASSVFTLMLGTGTDIHNVTKGYVQLQLQSTNISANTFDGRSPRNFSARIPPEKGAPRLTHYRFLQDRRGGQFVVFVNGRKLAEWKVPTNTNIAPGGYLTFQADSWGPESSWTIAKLRIRPWDGNVEPDPPPGDAGKDLLSTDAGARRAGMLESVSETSVGFGGNEFSRREPLFIRFAGKAAPAPKDAVFGRVRLARRGEFDASAVEITEGNARVRTSFAGEITLSLEAIASIDLPHRRDGGDVPAGASGRLVFANGDILRASLISAGPDNVMRWRPTRGEALDLGFGGFAGAILTNGAVPSASASSAVARFRNGDWVAGELVRLDGNRLRFKHPLAGLLEVDRAKLGGLYFGATGAVPVWDGCPDRDAWMRGPSGFGSNNASGRQSGWRYLDGTFALQDGGPNQWNDGSNHVLGRNLAALPEKVEVSFDVAAKNGQLALMLQLFTDPVRGGGMMIQWNGDQASIEDTSPQEGFFQRQPVQIQLEKGNPPNRSRRFRLLADRKTGQVAMFENGKLAGRYSPRVGKPSPKRGKSVVFMPQGVPLAISNLWIAPWVGTFPKPVAKSGDAPQPAESESPPSDVILLANGDETPGVIEGATPDELRLKCEAGDVECPLTRALMVAFAGEPIPPTPGLRLRLAGGGALTVQSFKLSDGTVSCRSALLGELSFPVSALTEITFRQPGQLPLAGIPPEEKVPVKRPRAPLLEQVRLDATALEGLPARDYDYVQSVNGVDSVAGRFTIKTLADRDSVTFEDELVSARANLPSVSRKTTGERNSTLRMKRILSASSRAGRQVQQTVSVADNKATIHVEGFEPKRADQIVDYPPNTVTLCSLMRIVTALPKEAGGAWHIDSLFNDFLMGSRTQQNYRLECGGVETVERDDRMYRWTRFTLRAETNDEDVAAEFFLDEKSVLQRAEVAGRFSLRLRADK